MAIHLRLITNNISEARADFEKLEQHIASVSDSSEEYVKLFIDLKNRNKIKGSERDIYYWLKKPAEDLIEFLDEISTQQSRSEEKRYIKSQGAEFITETPKWRVYKILTHDACRQYGKNTKWCITEESDFYWRKYALQGCIFYFCISKEPIGSQFEKLALQCRNRKIDWIWDSLDKSYKPSDLAFLDLPDLKDEIAKAFSHERIAPGLLKSAHNILRVNKRKLAPEINIPNNIAAIPAEAFASSSIEKINFEDNSLLKQINAGTFFNCEELTEVKLPQGLKLLANGAFHTCTALKEIHLPTTLETINPFCFKNCESLSEIHIPAGVKVIAEEAFAGCDNLEHVYIDTNNIEIDATAFAGCPKLIIHGSEVPSKHFSQATHNRPAIFNPQKSV